MKTMLSALAVAGLVASGAAFACDDLRMTDDASASKALDKPVIIADKASDSSAVKQKPAAKKPLGKPVPAGAVLARTTTQ